MEIKRRMTFSNGIKIRKDVRKVKEALFFLSWEKKRMARNGGKRIRTAIVVQLNPARAHPRL